MKRQLNDEFFTLWVLIAQTKDALLRARQREYDQFNINNERRAVLWAIQNHGGQASPVEISRQLFRELNSVSEMLSRMEKQGLIKKYNGTGKSKVNVKLTESGREALSQSLYNQTDKRILSILSKKQRERLASYLWTVRNQALKELGIPEQSVKFPTEPVNNNHNNK